MIDDLLYVLVICVTWIFLTLLQVLEKVFHFVGASVVMGPLSSFVRDSSCPKYFNINTAHSHWDKNEESVSCLFFYYYVLPLLLLLLLAYFHERFLRSILLLLLRLLLFVYIYGCRCTLYIIFEYVEVV